MQITHIARSTAYYQAVELFDQEFEIRRIVDEIHIKYPFMGSRRIRLELAKQGKSVNRKRVVRIMRQMGIAALYPKPRTTVPNIAHKIYPYLLRNLEVNYANQA